MQTFEDYLLTLDPVPAMFRDAMRQGWDAAIKASSPHPDKPEDVDEHPPE